MKCPKCGYLGFEHVDRCRNCGYDFSLVSTSLSLPELPIRQESTISPLDDLSLIDAATAPPPDTPMSDAVPDLDASTRMTQRPSVELPLFGPPIPDDEPLITRPSPPRPPLAVRRSTPDAARVRTPRPRSQSLDQTLESLDLALEPETTPPPPVPATPTTMAGWSDLRTGTSDSAAITARLIAVAIDLVILAVIDFVVIYFTMQICGITAEEASILPKGPLLAFLLVQNGGYLVAFTASGQTLGKMAMGIRVVGANSEDALDVGRAFTRTAIWMILAIPAGLGFLTLLGRDHRGLHDRFAGTRVVRAPA